MPEDHPLQSLRDHDVLIRLDQKVDLLSTDIKELKENVAARVTSLELLKAEKSDVALLIKDMKKLQEETIPGIKYRIAYWSGALALILLAVEAYLRIHH
jgi:hypothetical protein